MPCQRPGKRYVDWELEDPSGKSLAEIRPIRDEIERRVRGLMAELGVSPAGYGLVRRVRPLPVRARHRVLSAAPFATSGGFPGDLRCR